MMNTKLAKVKAYLDREVANHSIYVWGGSGQSNVTEAWIRQKEARSAGGKNADRAVAFWKKQVAAGYGAILRAFDCSGLVSLALKSVGLIDKRSDCDRLWSKCTRISAPVDGALLFRVSPTNANDETHVGMYFGGKQYHAKGRDDGVVCEPYKASYWHKIGWLIALSGTSDTPPAASTGTFSRVLRRGSRGADVAALKALLIKAGYSDGITAGNETYGGKTAALVRRVQIDKGLTADGKAGRDTVTALGGKWSGA